MRDRQNSFGYQRLKKGKSLVAEGLAIMARSYPP
jgi:hypothetical protein